MKVKNNLSQQQHQYGHRARLRERLIVGQGEGLLDYEILELILCSARSRIDLKPIAKKLVERFGGFSKVFYADVHELKKVPGIGETSVSAILCVREAMVRVLRGDLCRSVVVDTWKKLLDYLRVRIGNSDVENFYVLYLNKKYCLIADEVQHKGTVDETPLYVREVIKRSLSLGAVFIVVSHNHPSGDPSPSQADVRMTAKLREACFNVGITLVDHVIVTSKKHYSFKTHGLL